MSKQIPERVWLITGASTGFGREMAEQLLARGAKVVATARKPEQLAEFGSQYPDTALILPLDVMDQAAVDSAVKAALDRFGGVDVLVNNAGYGVSGAIEEVSEAEFMPMFETNVFGLLRVTRALLPQFRERKRGNIVNISSIGGLIGTPGVGYYNASKFAVNGLSEALAGEMAPLGVHVTVVEPGPFRTDFLGRSATIAAHQIEEYKQSAGKSREYFETQAGKQAGDPVKAVEAILAAVEAPEPPRHLVLGKQAYERMQARLELWSKDLATWKDTTLGADYDSQGEAR